MTTQSETPTISLSAELAPRVAEAARALELTESELVNRILERHLRDLHWQAIFRYGQERGRASGYGPEDVERLVEEVRAELAAEQT